MYVLKANIIDYYIKKFINVGQTINGCWF